MKNIYMVWKLKKKILNGSSDCGSHQLTISTASTMSFTSRRAESRARALIGVGERESSQHFSATMPTNTCLQQTYLQMYNRVLE